MGSHTQTFVKYTSTVQAPKSSKKSSKMAPMIADRMFTLPAVNQAAGIASPYIQSMDNLACSGFDKAASYIGSSSDQEYRMKIELAERERRLEERERRLNDREKMLDDKEKMLNDRDGRWTQGLRNFAAQIIKSSSFMSRGELDKMELMMDERERCMNDRQREIDNTEMNLTGTRVW